MKNSDIVSFVKVDPESHFSIHNLPYGIFKDKKNPKPRAGVAIGDLILDLSVIEQRCFFKNILNENQNVFSNSSLNNFMSLGRKTRNNVRAVVQNLLSESNTSLKDDESLRNECLLKMNECIMCMPVEIGNYTDFYSSKEHATNVGIMFRGKENALMPNWLHLPVAYHGRASSIVVSGTEIIRPKGQTNPDETKPPMFGPSKLLDFELEMGFLIGTGNKLGSSIPVDKADEHIFGMVIVNDWSARDIQKWEYVPLGPFLGKNFATSISPWVVTLEALEPFRTKRIEQDPEPLEYLSSKDNWSFDINLEVDLKTEKQNESYIISKTNYKYLYWDICQQLAHHTVNGCNMKTGDLLASGTISGPDKKSLGSMLELSWRGTESLKLPDGEERKFLHDGDTIKMTAWCQGDGYRVGFGDVTGKIIPAI